MRTKEIIVCILVFLIITPTLKGQDSLLVNPVKIDSLHQLIQGQNNIPEEKVRLLNEYARLCFFNQNFEEGFKATVEARDLSRKIDFKGGEIMYNITLTAFFLPPQRSESDYYQHEAIILTNENPDVLSKYYVELSFPRANYQNNFSSTNFKRVENRLKKLNSLYQFYLENGDKEIQAIILSGTGFPLFFLQRYDELKMNVQKAIELNIELNQLYLEILHSTFLMSMVDSDESLIVEKNIIQNLSKIKNRKAIGRLNKALADSYRNAGKYTIAIEHYLKSATIFETLKDLNALSSIYSELGFLYETLELHGKAVHTYEKFIDVFKQLKNTEALNRSYERIIFPLYQIKEYEKARKYMDLALIQSKVEDHYFLEAKSNMLEGQILMDEKKYEEALSYLHKTNISFSKIAEIDRNGAARYGNPFTLFHISECYFYLGDFQNALTYAKKCLESEDELNHRRTILKEKISFLFSEIYMELQQTDNAFKYIKMHQEIVHQKKETENTNKVAEDLIRSVIEKSEKEKELLEKDRVEKEQKAKIQRVWIFSISGAFVSTIIISLILYKNNKNKQKAHGILKNQKEKIQNTLNELKSTQSQLIQSEKMASLGELTAGIAHEIQNPLNFVNNFSEVSEELLDELTEEIENGSGEDMKEIVSDLKQNLSKISHHGNRASSIVKGMLDHSRTSSGEKVLTDMNVLSDEYLRLSYHGLRAKDKSFNANFVTNFDKSIRQVPIIPQNFGRVLLNLINNAFYSVNKKGKEATEDYEPTVTVSTKEVGAAVFISIRDNGEGIPKEILDKIFQPFFTTKPTGKGTGLGLSLAYDIVTKEHGGQLTVTSKQGFYTKFTIELPTLKNKQL